MISHTQTPIGGPPIDDVDGLLYSQIGYDVDQAIRLIVRSNKQTHLGDNAICRISATDSQNTSIDATPVYWGSLWASHWWVVDLTGQLAEGVYQIDIIDTGKTIHHGDQLRVGTNLLWSETWEHVSYEQLERRSRIAKVKPGWYDAGTLWEESNSHSAMILGLLDLLNLAADQMTRMQRERVITQLRGGCDYLMQTQQYAREHGYADGAMVHDMLERQHMIMVPDVAKAAAVLARSARILPGDTVLYRQAASKALSWLLHVSTPAGDQGFGFRAHGVEKSFAVPAEHRTSDLLMCCWAALELARAGESGMEEQCVELAGQILDRQVPEAKSQDGLYGHFYTFKTGTLTEKAWTHSGAINPAGADNGQTFPQYVMPLIEMLRLWPEHEKASTWRKALQQYAYGFFLPACRLSPFFILPLGYYPNAGWLHFAALWHGMNAVYPLAASLALEFQTLFKDDTFAAIATGNLQWIAGLNAGVTHEAMRAAHLTSANLPKGQAIPHSMIHGIGNRTIGSWLQIRGSICNGFGCGDQFQLDVEPTLQNDGPFALHDEDWITHNGGWLCAIARLIRTQTATGNPKRLVHND